LTSNAFSSGEAGRFLRIERPQDFDGPEILGKLLLGSAFAEAVVVGDAVFGKSSPQHCKPRLTSLWD
jgi:hypothetical protein